MSAEYVARFAAGLHSSTQVLSRGTLHHPELGPVAAVHTYSHIYGQAWVWAYTARRRNKPPSGMEPHNPVEVSYVAGVQP